MTPDQEQTLLTGVGQIQIKVENIESDVKEIKKVGCNKGFVNNGKIKLNTQSLGFMKWVLGMVILGILGMAFFIIRQKITGG